MSVSVPTMIDLRNYADNIRYLRRPSTELGAYDNLVPRCFSDFNINPERFSVHIHFRRNAPCEGKEVLKEDDWDNGEYENGGELILYAHFTLRLRSRSDSRDEYRPRESTTPPAVPSPESPWIQPPLPRVDEQGLPVPGYQTVHPVPDVSGPAPTPVPPTAPLQPPPAVRRPATQRRNTDSTTVYSLCTPLPRTRYRTTTYFSSPYIFIPLPPGLPRPRSHPQRYMAPFPGFRPQSSAPVTGEAATPTTSTAARRRPSAPAAIGNRSLASQPQSHDGFLDSPPVTRRGRPRTGEQNVRSRPPVLDEFDFPLEFDDGSTARRLANTGRRARADQKPVLPPLTGGEFDFPLDFDDPPVVRQQPHQQQQREQEHQEQEVQRLPEEEERASVASSVESFDFPLELDDSPVSGQQQHRAQTEGRASVARSEDSFGQFVTEEIESALFVTDESERDFEDELAWEDDEEEEQEKEAE